MKRLLAVRQTDLIVRHNYLTSWLWPMLSLWTMLNWLQTGQSQCAANLHKWQIASLDKCSRGHPQTMNHIVESCPLTKLADNGFLQLQSVDDNTVTRLRW